MRTLIKMSLIGCMALAIVCTTTLLGHTQDATTQKFLCAKCGVVTEIGNCPPGTPSYKRPCVDIKDFRQKKEITTISPGGYAEPARDIGHAPEWSHNDVSVSKPMLCAKCGKAFHIDERMKEYQMLR